MYLWLYVFLHNYTYLQLYLICTCNFTCILISICMYASTCNWIFTSIAVLLAVLTSVVSYMYLHLYLYIYAPLSLSVYACTITCTCGSVPVHIYLRLHHLLLYITSVSLLILYIGACIVIVELPLSPINLTIEEIFSTAAVLKWTVVSFDLEEEAASSGHFQLIVQRMGHPPGPNGAGDQQLNGHSSRIIDVPGLARSFLIQFLIPDTGYRVYAAAINEHGRSNLSDPVDFQTLLGQWTHK